MTKETRLLRPQILPDLSDLVSVDKAEVKRRFRIAAEFIMLHCELIAGDKRFDIDALELYIFHADHWPDTSTHAHRLGVVDQLTAGKWYVHNGGKLPPKRLGVDMTAGVKASGIHAGMLIAGIGTKDGSGNAIKSILEALCGNRSWKYSDEEKDLIRSKIQGSDVLCGAYIRIEQRVRPRLGQLWIGRRKGLANSRNLEERYKNACLRIAVDPPCKGWRSTAKLQMVPL